jgi:hypothetical protein
MNILLIIIRLEVWPRVGLKREDIFLNIEPSLSG